MGAVRRCGTATMHVCLADRVCSSATGVCKAPQPATALTCYGAASTGKSNLQLHNSNVQLYLQGCSHATSWVATLQASSDLAIYSALHLTLDAVHPAHRAPPKAVPVCLQSIFTGLIHSNQQSTGVLDK